MDKRGFLVLEDGTVFEGRGFGAEVETVAEFVFNTGMNGHENMLADPVNAGLGIVAAFPVVGSWGAPFEGKGTGRPGASALVCREVSFCPPNNTGAQDINDFMIARGITGLKGVDTRQLTRRLRAAGSLKGAITFDAQCTMHNAQLTEQIQNYKVQAGKLQIEKLDGKIIIGDGPGDPADYARHIPEVKALMESGLPVFGIGLGHQLIALAKGFQIVKLPHGHRGANYPVKETATGKLYITAQNHGYAVDAKSVNKDIAEIAYTNLHDGSVEGLIYKDCNCASLQFFPETGPYVLRPNALFLQFIKGNTYAKT